MSPRETLAGAPSMLIQKDTQDMITIRLLGTNTWIKKYLISRLMTNRISAHGKIPAQINSGNENVVIHVLVYLNLDMLKGFV